MSKSQFPLQILLGQFRGEGLTFPEDELESLVILYQKANPDKPYPTPYQLKRFGFIMIMEQIAALKAKRQ